jgi:hypothetical protein
MALSFYHDDLKKLMMLLPFPKFIITGLDLTELTCSNENRSFTNIGYSVCNTLEVMGHP